MRIQAEIDINAPKEKIWKVITDIDNAADRIEGIIAVDVLERPSQGLIGLKWQETRTMFGKEATEVMWITEAKENVYYQTRAESHGAVYKSGMHIEEKNDGTNTLIMKFVGEPQSFGAKLMSAAMGWMFRGATKKMILKDLQDIKATVEKA